MAVAVAAAGPAELHLRLQRRRGEAPIGAAAPILRADQLKDVKVVNTPDVTVVSTPNVNIDTVREPFQEVRFDTPDGFSESTAEFQVPAGKRLVLEQVRGASTPPLGQIIRYHSLRTTVEGEFAFHTISGCFIAVP